MVAGSIQKSFITSYQGHSNYMTFYFTHSLAVITSGYIFSFAVTSTMVEPFLDEGITLEEAVNTQNIYICNLKVLDGVVCKDNKIVRFS